MSFAKSCPGSRAFREPTPEDILCPNCHGEVEVWTHELSAVCPSCGNRVFREQHPACIDWCPHAKECIGPEVYLKLKPETGKGQGNAEEDSPLAVFTQEHDKALRQIGFLRSATLCLSLSGKAQGAQVVQALQQGFAKLSQVTEFFEGELKRHFQREEEALFPLLERHIGKDGSPTRLLLAEHAEVWQWYHRLQGKLAEWRQGDGQVHSELASEIDEIGSHLVRLLEGHIKKENETLFPLARSLLGKEELGEVSRKGGQA
ncbi:MAG: hemerythrin domain-containing protein [Chloroflexota bacterium]|nr:hemerythrin domain-containing protein [Chloroflexota bacterium]